MSPMTSQPLTMEHALLGFLRLTPMHGYELFQTLSSATGLGLVWRLKQSQLYALLGKLEDRGYVLATVEPQENRPSRKVFHLTEDGRAALADWVRKPVLRPRELRLDFLAKLYFAELDGSDAVEQLVDGQVSRCHRWLKEYEARKAELDGAQCFDRSVWDLRIKQIEGMLEWLAGWCEQRR
jgi:PadR family transcriptional regulator, regulatory protein AphA